MEAFYWALRKQVFWTWTGHEDLSRLTHEQWWKGQVTELFMHPGRHLRQELTVSGLTGMWWAHSCQQWWVSLKSLFKSWAFLQKWSFFIGWVAGPGWKRNDGKFNYAAAAKFSYAYCTLKYQFDCLHEYCQCKLTVFLIGVVFIRPLSLWLRTTGGLFQNLTGQKCSILFP